MAWEFVDFSKNRSFRTTDIISISTQRIDKFQKNFNFYKKKHLPITFIRPDINAGFMKCSNIKFQSNNGTNNDKEEK